MKAAGTISFAATCTVPLLYEPIEVVGSDEARVLVTPDWENAEWTFEPKDPS